MLIEVLGAFFSIAAFSIVLNMPRHLILYSGIIAGLSWLAYLIIGKYTSNIVILSFLVAFIVALLSNIFARKLKSPVTLFLVSGILPIVPGFAIYRTVYYMLADAGKDANYYFLQTLQGAGAIAMGIFLVESFFRLKRSEKEFEDI